MSPPPEREAVNGNTTSPPVPARRDLLLAQAVAEQMDRLIAACRREGVDINWVGFGSAVALCGAAHAAALIADPDSPDPAWEVIRPALRRRVSLGVAAEGQPQRQRKRQVDGPQRVR